ncbi:MAG: hypothetical protein JJT75_01420 [Opitutales bacterium]|nr:hypothetical protein [Opitutales bacterium]MCH8541626.1 hypothetical protein [Opitutales bacterium]
MSIGHFLLASSLGFTFLLLSLGVAFAWFLPRGEKKMSLFFIALAVLLGAPLIFLSLFFL